MFNHVAKGFNRTAKWNRIVFKVRHYTEPINVHVRTRIVIVKELRGIRG